MSGPFDFNAYGDDARRREMLGNNHAADVFAALAKPVEDRDFYDQAKVQQAPTGSMLVQLVKLLTGG